MVPAPDRPILTDNQPLDTSAPNPIAPKVKKIGWQLLTLSILFQKICSNGHRD